MATIGTLSYKIIANTASFTSGMVATRKELRLGRHLMDEGSRATTRYGLAITRLNRLYKKGAVDAKGYAWGMKQISKEAMLQIPIIKRLSAHMGFYLRLLAGAGLITGARRAHEFNKALTNSLAIMGDDAMRYRDQMIKTANEVSYYTKFNAKEAAEAYFFLASAGLTAKESIEALPAVAKFAQAGNFDLATAT